MCNSIGLYVRGFLLLLSIQTKGYRCANTNCQKISTDIKHYVLIHKQTLLIPLLVLFVWYKIDKLCNVFLLFISI